MKILSSKLFARRNGNGLEFNSSRLIFLLTKNTYESTEGLKLPINLWEIISSSILISFDIDFVINPIETPTLKVPVWILLKIRWFSSGNVSQIFLICKFFSSSLSFDNSGIVSLSNSLRLIFDNFLILEVVKKSEAKNVFFHHGDSEALSKYLIEKESINVLFFGK